MALANLTRCNRNMVQIGDFINLLYDEALPMSYG